MSSEHEVFVWVILAPSMVVNEHILHTYLRKVGIMRVSLLISHGSVRKETQYGLQLVLIGMVTNTDICLDEVLLIKAMFCQCQHFPDKHPSFLNINGR